MGPGILIKSLLQGSFSLLIFGFTQILMDLQPLFSIITCTYNSDNFVESNINSVIGQTYKNYEHLFIDGNSSDNTLDIISKYQSKYPQKVNLHSRAPQGISDAFNECIREAKGQYIIHLNSDDSFYNNQECSV